MKPDEILEQFKDFNVAMELYTTLGINESILINPVAVSKVMDIAKFVNIFQDGASLIRNVATKSRPEDRLEKVWNYTALQGKRISLEENLSNLKKEISLYE